MASETPVLPVEASTIGWPGASSPRARAGLPPGRGLFEDADDDPVLDAAGGVQRFELGEEADTGFRREAAQFDHGRPAHAVADGGEVVGLDGGHADSGAGVV